MSALKGKNYTNNTATPKVQSKAGEVNGVKRVLFDEYDGTPIAADTISIGYLPKGARVLDIKSIGLGSGSSFNVAPGDVMSAATLVIGTVGSVPSLNPMLWVEYVVD